MTQKSKKKAKEDQSVPTHTLRVVPPPRGARHAYLHIMPGDKVFPLRGRNVTLGSSSENSLPIADPAVSREHCALERKGRRWWLRDLGSKNGVFVNGSKVRDAELGGGDAICIGGTTLRFTESKGIFPNLSKVRKCGDMVAQSPAMVQVFYRLEELAKTDLSLLLQGESGTGKELVARAIHDLSRRSARSLVPVNCGALPPDLLEAELFGHEKGAFTGADRAKPGVFESAHGGTLFLDEIGELPLEQQPALLRVLDSKKIRRLGSNRHRNVNVRVICASNKDLKSMVAHGRFRRDLYFRLAECTLSIPPLRDRPSDIPVLLDLFLRQAPASQRAEAPERWVLDALMKHSWPGNIRELRNLTRRATALGWESAIEEGLIDLTPLAPPHFNLATLLAKPPGDAETSVSQQGATAAKQPKVDYCTNVPLPFLDGHSLEEIEKAMLTKALEASEGSQAAAAKKLNMKRSTFRLKLKRHRLL